MVISKTPLRCSFFGGGTDFREYFEKCKFGYGMTISTALNMYIYITVNKKFDDKIRIVYYGNESVDTVDEVKHNIIREAMKITGVDKGVEIIYMADIPLSGAGVGLASSSALAVGVLNALYAYKGVFVTPEYLAQQACQIEINLLGQKIGIQDQYAVALGGFKKYYYYNTGKVDASPAVYDCILQQSLERKLLLFYTGMTRQSHEILAEQASTIDQKMEMLDSLVELTDDSFQALQKGELEQWGHNLDIAWNIKKKFAKGVTNAIIDDIYEKAKKAGALGGKILGAGGGGFVLLYADEQCHDNIIAALSGYRKIDFAFEPQGSRIIFVD